MEVPETFTLLPLTIDPTTKTIGSASSRPSAAVRKALDCLNTTHKEFLNLSTPNGAPPPLQQAMNPQRSQSIQKTREAANQQLKKGNTDEAIKLYNAALQEARDRPTWEPAQLAREEIAMLLSNRAQAYLNARKYADALVDVDISLECKRGGNPKAHWRGARALVEMGRKQEALERITSAADVEDAALVGAKQQLEQIKGQIAQMQAQIAAQGGQGQIPPQAIAQAKAVEEAVKAQEDGVRELREYIKELSG